MPENAEIDPTCLRLRIEGVVQGVGFRAYVVQEARALGLDGWVRNRSDGTVEALVSGDTKQVEALVAACMRGPPGARVSNVDLHKAEPPGEKGFRHRPTL
jgi:acylphosphatase